MAGSSERHISQPHSQRTQAKQRHCPTATRLRTCTLPPLGPPALHAGSWPCGCYRSRWQTWAACWPGACRRRLRAGSGQVGGWGVGSGEGGPAGPCPWELGEAEHESGPFRHEEASARAAGGPSTTASSSRHQPAAGPPAVCSPEKMEASSVVHRARPSEIWVPSCAYLPSLMRGAACMSGAQAHVGSAGKWRRPWAAAGCPGGALIPWPHDAKLVTQQYLISTNTHLGTAQACGHTHTQPCG